MDIHNILYYINITRASYYKTYNNEHELKYTMLHVVCSIVYMLSILM